MLMRLAAAVSVRVVASVAVEAARVGRELQPLSAHILPISWRTFQTL
jgi:hypothetical protein